MRELFVYWRTKEAEAAARAVRAFQAELRAEHPTLRATIYRRADERAGAATTLMETYAGSALTAALESRIRTEGDRRLARWLDGPRTMEVFEPLPDV